MDKFFTRLLRNDDLTTGQVGSGMRLIESYLAILILFSVYSMAGAVVNPNVMIEFDSSGSMADMVPALPAYAPGTTYAAGVGVPSYTGATVYQQDANGNIIVYATGISSVTSTVDPSDAANARFSLGAYGLWFGAIGPIPLKLFSGNYLNYETCPQGTNTSGCTAQVGSFSKISIAKRLMIEMISVFNNVNIGIMDFDPSCSPGMTGTCNGVLVAPIGTSTTTLASDINGISANSWTPTGPTMLSIGTYYSSGFAGKPSPIVNSCQSNSIVLVTDGEFNVPCAADPNATGQYTASCAGSTADPAADATTLHNGQNHIIINAIGLDAPGDPLGSFAAQNLKQTATNGGGTYFAAAGTASNGLFSAQLEQALFSLPSSVVLNQPTSPNGNFILSGNATLSATVQNPNTTCISKPVVQFYVDGVAIGGQVSNPPFTTTWDTTQVSNATHILTAVLIDGNGVTSVSNAIAVGVLNTVTLPIITSDNITVYTTSAAVNWTTNVQTNGQVLYGLTAGYGQTTVLQDNNPMTTAHTVILSGLASGTQYHLELVSKDSGGHQATLGDLTFVTQALATAGPLDHFKITFTNNNVTQAGPGTQSGNYPWVLTAGSCFVTTIEALDAGGLHTNYNGTIILSQYLLDNTGLVETALAPGINLAANAPPAGLGISSMSFTMTSGFLSLGSASDPTTKVCFYRGTREPLDGKSPGSPGDLHLKVVASTNSAVGISASYVVWRGAPTQLLVVPPGDTLAQATPTGLSGSVLTENQGAPFSLLTYLTDAYFNPDTGASDSIEFSSSLSTQTGFSPFSGSLSGGNVITIVTVNACNTSVTLSAQDQTMVTMTAGQTSVPIGACGAARYFDQMIPNQVVAGAQFSSTITVHNLNIPLGSGSVLFSGTLAALVPLDSTHFTPAATLLGVPVFSFQAPEGTAGDYSFVVPNQIYTKAGQIWIRLTGGNPSDLKGATSLAGPLTVIPGPPTILNVAVGQATVGPFAQTQVIATLTDAYGNGITGQPVSIQLTAGTGSLGTSGSSGTNQTLTTNSSGQAVFTFNSAGLSETDNFTVVTPTLPGIAPTNTTVLVSLLGNAQIAAYPSPVKITQQPLTIEYRLAQNSNVKLTINDLFGRTVWQQYYDPGAQGGILGFNRVTWDGRNTSGTQVAVGIYVVHLEATANGQKVATAKYRFGVSK